MKVSYAELWIDGLTDCVVSAINEWDPLPANCEADCQRQLAAYLRECFPDARVEREFKHLGQIVDLYVRQSILFSHEVFIELKFDLLKDQNEANRLQGQIANLEPNRHEVIVLLCGETKPEFLARLKHINSNVKILTKPFPRSTVEVS
jgi:hypothetical protein